MLKRRIVILLILLAALAVSPALAEVSSPIWFGSSDKNAADSVGWYVSSGTRYFLLPGCADSSIWFAEGSKVTINNKSVENGVSSAEYDDGDTITVRIDGKKYKIKIEKGSNIPAVFISTESGSLDAIDKSKDNKEKGSIVIRDGSGTDYAGGISEIRKRGNSSLNFRKKSYQIKLEEKASICGMTKSKTWLLLSNQIDNSLIRNEITLAMAKYAGMQYVPEGMQVDLYINNEYKGLYFLCEKVQIKSSRIAIRNLENDTEDANELPLSQYPQTGSETAKKGAYKAYEIPENPEDITGGYLIEFDRTDLAYKQAESAYFTKRGLTLEIKSPSYASVEQMKYISEFMQGFEDAIFSKTGINDSGKHYSDYIDMTSLASAYLVQEISKNYDSNTSSLFFYKPSDSESTVAYAGPPWDFNCSWGSYARSHNKGVLKPAGFWANSATGKSYWWPALYKKADFAAKAAELYSSNFKPAIEILLGLREEENGMLSLETYSSRIEASYQMNFLRWGYGTIDGNEASAGKSFKANMEYLQNFIEKRYEFLNKEWNQ